MLEAVLKIAQLISYGITIFGFIAVLIKPIRNKLFSIKKANEGETEGVKCLLRSELLKTYYRGRDSETLEQYEAENFMKLYAAYKDLGGNSFVDEIYAHVIKWEIKK